MPPEIDQSYPRWQVALYDLARRRREKYLPSVGCSADTRPAVNIQSDETLVDTSRLSRVYSHPH